MNKDNIQTISLQIPIVTSGMYVLLYRYAYRLINVVHLLMLTGTLYTYLACGVGRSEPQGAFRALTRGYNHWASGRLDQLQVHTKHPEYCHVRGTTTPSMKPGSYHIYLLLCREGQVANIKTATCEFAAG